MKIWLIKIKCKNNKKILKIFLKKAEKLAFYNCDIKSIKSTICKDVEIETKILKY